MRATLDGITDYRFHQERLPHKQSNPRMALCSCTAGIACAITLMFVSVMLTRTAFAIHDETAQLPHTHKVTDYAPVLQPCFSDAGTRRLFALRKFFLHGSEHYLVVDIDTLRTEILSAEHLVLAGGRHASNSGSSVKIIAPYFGAIAFCTMPPYRLHNHGIRGFSQKLKGAVLSADLCPSKYTLDRTPFQSALAAFSEKMSPLPVAIAVSGKWLDTHPADITWLMSMHEKKQLDITWINHSYSHPREYRRNPKLLSKGFLLTEGTDINAEIFNTEIAMIEAGITPSVFFRFPGLVASEKLVKKVCELGLIPVGSNAWLAKRERPKGGSIILIHANRHEPKGIVLFRRLLAEKQMDIRRGKWKLLNIRECLSSEFSQLAINKSADRPIAASIH